MDTLISFLLLGLGLAMLVIGGDLLVRGASTMARVLGISELVVGLTVVAFGTSAPELAVNVLAAYEGKSEISFGNIVGSNIANIGLILGIAAMIRPLDIRSQVIRRELPMMLLATLAVGIMAADRLLRSEVEILDLSDALVLLLLFGVFLYYSAAEVLYKCGPDVVMTDSAGMLSRGAPGASRKSLVLSIVMTVAGLALLVGGGHVTVDRAAAIALTLGVPQVVIGLTLVAVGTSLPELVTSVVAVCRGQSDLAIGNVIGSNIFNLLFVLAVSAVVRPVAVPAGGWFDLIWMGSLSLLLIPMVLTANQRLLRREGLALLGAYVGYITWRVLLVLNAK